MGAKFGPVVFEVQGGSRGMIYRGRGVFVWVIVGCIAGVFQSPRKDVYGGVSKRGGEENCREGLIREEMCPRGMSCGLVSGGKGSV